MKTSNRWIALLLAAALLCCMLAACATKEAQPEQTPVDATAANPDATTPDPADADGEDEELKHIDEGGNYIATICQDPVGESEVTVEAIKTVLGGGSVEGGHETPAKVYGKGVGYVTSDELLK